MRGAWECAADRAARRWLAREAADNLMKRLQKGPEELKAAHAALLRPVQALDDKVAARLIASAPALPALLDGRLSTEEDRLSRNVA